MTCRWWLVFVTFFAGCLDLGEYPQGPGGDAGSTSADGGGLTVDGGGVVAPDSGVVDGGLSEPPPDSGVSSDAGPNGERDAGAVVAHAGLTMTDGGIRTDGGTTTPDAGSLTDAGGPRADAGALDSGSSDAGLPPTEPPCSPNATLTGTERLILEMKAEDWLVLPNTRFSDSCVRDSNLAGRDGCTAVITAWSGGAFDDGHRQLLVTGGGHLN